MLKTIIWNIENDIGHMVLNRPPSNTMTHLFFDELRILTSEIIPKSGVKAIIIYGNGRHFSSGADPVELRKRIIENLPSDYPERLPSFLEENTRSFLYIGKLEIPTFAAIRGVCFGSAMELALFFKFRICAEGAVLGFPETSFGLMPGCGGTIRLPRITGKAKAIEIITGGKNFSAEDAYNWGIVHKIVERKILIAETVKIAEKMIRG
jgi:enoyl-CoA hydratase/carnithine racemase